VLPRQARRAVSLHSGFREGSGGEQWLVSAPGLAPPVRRPGALPPPPGPRLAEYACSRDHDAYDERGHAGKQQQFMKNMKKPGHDSLPHRTELHPASSTIRNSLEASDAYLETNSHAPSSRYPTLVRYFGPSVPDNGRKARSSRTRFQFVLATALRLP
jgi:hypothetical protein